MLGGLRELEQNGCLLMNATGSTLGHDDAMRVVVSHYYADLRAAIAAGVAARRPDLDAAAADLMTTTCTSLVLSSMMSVRISHETAAEMLTTPDAKARARAVTGAAAADMESYGIAEVASARNLPFAALRVVADTSDDSLPSVARAARSEEHTSELQSH